MEALPLLQMLLHADRYLEMLVAHHGALIYALLFLIVFCETGLLPLFFLPGDPLLFICGAFCATGAINPWLLIPLLVAAAVLGSCLNYRMGQALGERAYLRDYRWLDRAALLQAHAFYEKHGRLTFLLSPYIAVVRTFAPFVGGVAHMTFHKFLAAAGAGAALWVVGLVMGGYLFGNVPLVREHITEIVLLGLALGLGGLALGGVLRVFRNR